jgi:hypothetical protein
MISGMNPQSEASMDPQIHRELVTFSRTHRGALGKVHYATVTVDERLDGCESV